MTKTETKKYGLKGGHPNTFRRTVNIGTEKKPEKVQLFFEPNKPLELTDKEIEGLQAEIADGFIVPWEDHGHGSRPVPPPTQAQNAELAAMKTTIQELTAQNAELQAAAEKVPAKALKDEIKSLKTTIQELETENADLTKQLEDATAPAESDEDDASEIEDPDAKLGDE